MKPQHLSHLPQDPGGGRERVQLGNFCLVSLGAVSPAPPCSHTGCTASDGAGGAWWEAGDREDGWCQGAALLTGARRPGEGPALSPPTIWEGAAQHPDLSRGRREAVRRAGTCPLTPRPQAQPLAPSCPHRQGLEEQRG